jgi:hypothetical protein
MPLFLFLNTQTMHLKAIIHTQQHCYAFPKNTLTLAGIEPGSAVAQADAMSTAPRIHFKKFAFCKNDLFTT